MDRVFQVFALIFRFFSIFYCVLGLFSAVVCSFHFSHCCCKLSPVGSVCFKLFFICCQRCVFVVRGIRCVWLFQFVFLTVSRLIDGCFVKSILELFQMQVA